MANNKRYYWIKLKNDFFDLPAIDWLMGQENGCEYIVLYQKLCLLSANTGGVLAAQTGEMLIRFDEKKIARTTGFDLDTVIVAVELFKKLGLILVQHNDVLMLPEVPKMIGSETQWAEKKRLARAKSRDKVEDKVGDNLGTLSDKRKRLDIEIDIDKDIDKDIDINKEREALKASAPSSKRFIKPTIEEIAEYCKSRNNDIDAESFYNFYQSKGWKVGNTPMKDWKACVITWEKRNRKESGIRERIL